MDDFKKCKWYEVSKKDNQSEQQPLLLDKPAVGK
jgi:hypothetical protein